MEYMVQLRLFQTTNHMPATGLLKNCIRWDVLQGYHICRSKISDSLNGYISRQQTSAILHF